MSAGMRNVDNTFALVADALARDVKDDLVELFETRAETRADTRDDKSWIEVGEAADLMVDNYWERIVAAKS